MIRLRTNQNATFIYSTNITWQITESAVKEVHFCIENYFEVNFRQGAQRRSHWKATFS